MTTTALDLTKEAPASPGDRVGGYVILARLADKARAEFMGGKIGSYHTDCPLDHMLLDWKGVPYADIKQEVLAGADNERLAEFLNTHGTPKTPDEVEAWSDGIEAVEPSKNPEKRDWFAAQCAEVGIDPEGTTMFEWLDADDEKSFS